REALHSGGSRHGVGEKDWTSGSVRSMCTSSRFRGIDVHGYLRDHDLPCLTTEALLVVDSFIRTFSGQDRGNAHGQRSWQEFAPPWCGRMGQGSDLDSVRSHQKHAAVRGLETQVVAGGQVFQRAVDRLMIGLASSEGEIDVRLAEQVVAEPGLRFVRRAGIGSGSMERFALELRNP